MARLRRTLVEEAVPTEPTEEFRKPRSTKTDPETHAPLTTTRQRRARYIISDDSDADESETGTHLIPEEPAKIQKRRTQVRLASLRATESCLSTLSFPELDDKERSLRRKGQWRRLAIQRGTSLQRIANNLGALPGTSEIGVHVPDEMVNDDDVDEQDVDESIWYGSASDCEEDSGEELPSVKKFLHAPRRPQKLGGHPPALDLSEQMKVLAIFDDVCEKKSSKAKTTKRKADSGPITVFDEDPPMRVKSSPFPQMTEPSRPGSSSDKENLAAIIRFSPPRNVIPIKSPRALERALTPPPLPQSPSKSRLKSPTKPKTRIPTPPHRPSLDAFWTAGAVNEWNDQYSPRKILKSPQKPLFDRLPSPTSPPASPSKLRSPSKAETALKEDFVARREDLAKSFLAELDTAITQGRVGALAASTGGVQLVWSKTLTSTAGRANWRKETIKTRDPKSAEPSQIVASVEKHYATIELATKVIDDEDRLLNVLAHEFCHLANFMVSGIKDQPHGKSFKEWGAKATKAFSKRGVEVTTKHSYAIEYKYIWVCGGWDGCGMEFKRHSKSIDVSRHRCGVCKGDLVQVKPVPRGAGKANATPLEPGKKGEKPAVTGYAAYVKLHFANVKKALPACSTHKDVMQALSRKYQAEKAAGGTSPRPTDEVLEDVVKELEAVKLGDSRSPIELE